MEKEQFEELLKLLKELNEYLENISSHMGGIDNTLDLILDKISKIG
jgi:hypothetical protein